MRRCPTLLVAALAFGLALQPTSSRADGLATYTLTSTDGLPAPSGPPPGTPPVTLSGTLSTGSPTVSLPSTTGVGVGYQVTGTGIPTGTTVTAIGSGGAQVTLSQNATANGGESLTFTPDYCTSAGGGTHQPGRRRCYSSFIFGHWGHSPFSRAHRDSTPAECMTILPVRRTRMAIRCRPLVSPSTARGWHRWPMAAFSSFRWMLPTRTRRRSSFLRTKDVTITLQTSGHLNRLDWHYGYR